jgi:CheY-like chemotaxis protein
LIAHLRIVQPMRRPLPQAPTTAPRIVVIDDQCDHLAYMTTLLNRLGYECRAFASARYGLSFMKDSRVDIVIADIFMPEMDGFELLRIVQRTSPRIPVVTLSGGDRRGGSDFYLNCTRRLGAVAALKKPFDVAALMNVLDYWVPLAAPGETAPSGDAKTSNELLPLTLGNSDVET